MSEYKDIYRDIDRDRKVNKAWDIAGNTAKILIGLLLIVLFPASIIASMQLCGVPIDLTLKTWGGITWLLIAYYVITYERARHD